jgi:hypothetical protein
MRGLVFFFCVFIILGCDSSIYENNIADDKSPEAKAEQLEIDLDDGKYSKIISTLERSDGVYTSYSDREKYLLQLAYLGSTGFDIIGNLEEFLGDKGDKDLTGVFLKSISGIEGFADGAVIQNKRSVYALIRGIDSAVNNPAQEHNIAFAAGLAASIDTFMLIGNFADELLTGILDGKLGGVPMDNISFDSDDPNYIGKVFEEIEKDPAASDALLDKIDTSLTEIVTNVDALENTIAILGGGTENLKDLEEFLDEMRRPNCDKSIDPDRCLDRDSIHDYIKNHIAQ